MNFEDALRLIALNDPTFIAAISASEPCNLSDGVGVRTMALARLAALIGTRGAVSSYGAEVADALAAGARPREIVGVMIGVAPIVGTASIVAAAPPLALALGYDIDAALEDPDT